jgi:hypothetical protein
MTTMQSRKNGDVLVRYLRQAALKREHCNLMPESWNSGATEDTVHPPVSKTMCFVI